MTEQEPTLVALYAYASGTPNRAAEFRWSPQAGVSFTVFDSEWGALGQQYYEKGVSLRAEGRTVLPSEGTAFMRALLKQHNMTYYELVDESSGVPD